MEKKLKILKAITVHIPLSKELINVLNFLNEVVTSFLLHWKGVVSRCLSQERSFLYSLIKPVQPIKPMGFISIH